MPPIDPNLENRLVRHELRLTAIETQMMHLQRDLETIHEVVLDQGRKLDQLSESLTRLTRLLEITRSSLPEPPTEKPPHY